MMRTVKPDGLSKKWSVLVLASPPPHGDGSHPSHNLLAAASAIRPTAEEGSIRLSQSGFADPIMSLSRPVTRLAWS